MDNEPTTIEVTAGPYRGQRLRMPVADAEAAIADGWAIDPFAPYQEGEMMSDEDRSEILAAAEAAAKKLRGEPIGEEEAAPKQRRSARVRNMTAGDSATYVTKGKK